MTRDVSAVSAAPTGADQFAPLRSARGWPGAVAELTQPRCEAACEWASTIRRALPACTAAASLRKEAPKQ